MTSPVEMSVSDARRDLAAVIDRTRLDHEPVYLTRHNQRVAVIVDVGDYHRACELAEDMLDVRAAEEARREMRETGEVPIPWEQVKADLGMA